MSWASIGELLIKVISVADLAEKIGKNDAARNAGKAAMKAAEKVGTVAKDTGKKATDKLGRIDHEGNKIFKYNKKKLSEMFSKDKISEEVYDYLVSELKNIHHFGKDTKGIEKIFEAMIKAKEGKKLLKLIKKYEKIRDQYRTV